MNNGIPGDDMSETIYSANNEDYIHSELEDAIDEVLAHEDSITGRVFSVFKGDVDKPSASQLVPNIAENLGVNAHDAYGEYSDMWPDCTDQASEELQQQVRDLVDTWADKHGLQPTFFGIDNIQEVFIKVINEAGDWKRISQAEYVLSEAKASAKTERFGDDNA